MRRDLVLRGLGENPSVPVDVLVRLLRDWPEPVAAGLRTRTALPVALQEQMAGHESYRVRCAVARHGSLDTAIRDRLLSDPNWLVRTCVFARREQPLPDEILMRLMPDLLDPPAGTPITSNELFEELFSADRTRVSVAVRHPDHRVRLVVAPYAGRDDLRFLLADPDPRVAAAAAASIAEHERLVEPEDLPAHHCHAFWAVLQRPLSRALAEQVAASGDVEAVRSVAGNPTLPPDVVDLLARHPEPSVRATIAYRTDLGAESVAACTADPDPAVRAVVATRAGLTGEQVAALAADPDEAVRTAVATYAYVSEDERAVLDGKAGLDADEAVRWARSGNPRLRRRAARHPDLPPEIVERLAVDSDAGTRVQLALNHPGAPGELLLSCFLDDPRRTRLLALSQFPKTGLSRFAGHTDPRVRLLVAHDPDAEPAVIDHLTTDPHWYVRKTMARCPRLPGHRLTALLENAELAAEAAANPSLDWEKAIAAL